MKRLAAPAALLTVALSATSLESAIAQSNVTGVWSQIYPWPDVGIHLHYLPTHKILTFSEAAVEDYGKDSSETYIVDMPDMGAPGTVTELVNKTTLLFCSGHSFLPNGRLIVLGGQNGQNHYGSTEVNLLRYDKEVSKYRWELQGTRPMQGGRWYASVTTLPNGEVVVVGGERNGPGDLNPMPQVWKIDGGWRALDTAQLAVNLYSPLHVAPNGKVFMSGSAQLTRYLDTSGSGQWTNVGNRLYSRRDYGSAVMYEPGKVLFAGGGDPPTATAEVIDLNPVSPFWKWTGSMHFPRRQTNATILPDGKVLVTGGTSSAGFNVATNAVLAAEIWNPATGVWTQVASMRVPRLYHSTALLLPDARVLSVGGGRPAPVGGVDNYNAEIYSPPYLFKGARPRISDAPDRVHYGEVFTVKTPDAASITRVTWVKLSSVTHAFNMNQRFNRLSFVMAGSALKVTAPSDSRIATPGHYMLFLLNSAGVPSIAAIIAIN